MRELRSRSAVRSTAAWASAAELYRKAVERRLNDRVGQPKRVQHDRRSSTRTSVVPRSTVRWHRQASTTVNPLTLEYDLGQGRRGERDSAVGPVLCALAGGEQRPSSITTPPHCCWC